MKFIAERDISGGFEVDDKIDRTVCDSSEWRVGTQDDIILSSGCNVGIVENKSLIIFFGCRFWIFGVGCICTLKVNLPLVTLLWGSW